MTLKKTCGANIQ